MKLYLRIISLLVLLLSTSLVYSQTNEQILNIYFLKNKIELNENNTFFNVLVLTNVSDKDIEFNLNINVPRDWELIGNSIEKISLMKNQSLSVPVRAAVSRNSKGGVGYSVNASAVDLKAKIIGTASSFFSFPIRNKLTIQTNKQTQYFNQETFESSFSVFFRNEGNVNEVIDLKLIPGLNIVLNNSLFSSELNKKFELESQKDTTINIKVNINPEAEFLKQPYYNVNLQIRTKSNDSLITKRVWFRYISWEYENQLDEEKNPLIVQLTAQNIFNDTKPQYRLNAYGRILLRKHRDIFYSVENWNRSTSDTNLWINSKWILGYENKKTQLILGDYTGSFEQNMYGRGFYLSQKIGDDLFKISATKRLEYEQVNFGTSYLFRFNDFSLEPGYAYSDDYTNYIKNSVAFIRPAFTLFKKHTFALSFGLNNYKLYSAENREAQGVGYNFLYKTYFKNLRLNINSDYGSPDYVGYYRGKLNFRLNGDYVFENKKNRINFYSTNLKSEPITISNTDLFTFTSLSNVTFMHSLKDNVTLSASLIYSTELSNSFAGIVSSSSFSSQSAKSELRINISQPYSSNSFSVSGKIGVVDVFDYGEYRIKDVLQPVTNSSTYTVSEVKLNVRKNNFGVFYIFFNGPRQLSQQFTWAYNDIFSKSFSLMPYYETSFFDKSLQVSFRGSYVKDLNSNNSRFNVNNMVNWKTKNNWYFQLINSISVQQRSGNFYDFSSFYTSTYFEFSIKKIFGIKQPRIKYYDMKAVFFRDYNGDGLKDANESGIDYIYSDINSQSPEIDLEVEDYSNEFLPAEFLSNSDGLIRYQNLPEGEYVINYNSSNKQESDYYNEMNEYRFKVNSDTTLLIPFKEKNKIFGRIVLHRAKFSKEDYPIGNIRITVIGNNEVYTTLTNEVGYFEISIPVTETYRVEVNNIFKENFDLRQPYYNVRFNGYKQFEVTFDFDEKKREIVFRDDDLYVTDNTFTQDSTILIRQTTLRGEVLSDKNLKPLFATVTVKNNKNGQIISEVMASSFTGKYNTNFFVDKNYSLTASFDGYWTHYEDLNIDQITTFDYITRNIVLTKIEKGETIKANNLKFDKLKSELSEAAKIELDNIAMKLKRNIDVSFDIKGYADSDENKTVDAQKLSLERAIAVFNYLSSKGVGRNRMQPLGLGSEKGVTGNSNAAGEQNRRVELIVTDFNKEINH